MKKKIPPKETSFDYQTFKRQALEDLKKGKPLTGKEGVLTPLIKQFLEAALEGELDYHLTQDKEETDNRRNGHGSKQLKTDLGSFELLTPRDRDSSFEPEIVKKRQTYLGEALDQKIISLYGLGMSYNDICNHLLELYGIDVSPGLLSNITDKILPQIKEWQARPLDSLYPFVWLDAMFFKVKQDGVVQLKSVYTILGLNIEGMKEVLGIYISESEGANFWLQVLADLNNRGVKDILIASIDNLKGFAEAINAIFPRTEVQLCLVHQVRNSLKYVASKDQKEFVKDLRTIYKAANKNLAEKRLADLDEKWGKKYPLVIKSWKANWDRLSNFFKYPEPIRRIIYTTNPIEGFHRQIRKVTKTKGAFTSENALLKLLYLAIQRISEKWVMPARNWALTIAQLKLLFENRLEIPLRTNLDTV